MASENDAATIEAAMRAAFEKMTPEDRSAFVRSLCDVVNRLGQAIAENADALWEARHGE